MRQARWNELDVADDLAVHDFSAGRQCPAAVDDDPRIDCLGVNERRFGVGDAPDIDVVSASFDHPQRLELLRVHVLEILAELLLWNGDGAVGWRSLENHGCPFAAPASLTGLTDYRGSSNAQQPVVKVR